jgi:hypothetical protein
MAETSGIFPSVNGDRKYFTAFFAEYFADFIGNGIYPNPSTQCQVLANGDMTVTLKPGNAYINGYKYKNDSDLTFTLDTADGVLSRIDRIVIRSTTLDREIKAYLKKGTFASSPVAPELQRDADMWELGVADIFVANGAVSISQANITDLRLNTTYCGIVHGIIDQVDGETLFIQFRAIFDDFMDQLETVLDENTAGNLLNLINANIENIGDLLNLSTAEKSNLVGAINELVTSKVSSIDFNNHVTDFNNHEILKSAETVLGHIKTESIDADGTLIFPRDTDIGRFGMIGNKETAELSGCVLKDDIIKLGKRFAGNDVAYTNAQSGTAITISGYLKIVLNTALLSGKTIKSLNISYYDYNASYYQYFWKMVRLYNVTTGKYSKWAKLSYAYESTNNVYSFEPGDFDYESSDIVEIHIMGNGQYLPASTTPTIVSGAYYSSTPDFASVTATTMPYMTIILDDVVNYEKGMVINPITSPKDFEAWHNVKSNFDLPDNTDIEQFLYKNPLTVNKLSWAYYSNTTVTSGQWAGIKFTALVDMPGIEIESLSNDDPLDVVYILDELKNILLITDLFTNQRYTKSKARIYYQFEANTIYYIVIKGDGTTINYSNNANALSNSYLSVTKGLLNTADTSNKYVFKSISPVLYESGEIAEKTVDTGIGFLLTRTTGTDSPVINDFSITYQKIKKYDGEKFEYIGKISITTPVTSLLFESIPQGFKKLKLVGDLRSAGNTNPSHLRMRINPDAAYTNNEYKSTVFGYTAAVDYGTSDTGLTGAVTQSDAVDGYIVIGYNAAPPEPIKYYVSGSYLNRSGWNKMRYGKSEFEAVIDQSDQFIQKFVKYENVVDDSRYFGSGIWKNWAALVASIQLTSSAGTFVSGEVELWGGR